MPAPRASCWPFTLGVVAVVGLLGPTAALGGPHAGASAYVTPAVLPVSLLAGASAAPARPASPGTPEVTPSGGDLNWYNETSNMSQTGGQPDVSLGGLAFDPSLGVMVLFGGCVGACSPGATNATWEYDGIGWQNLSGTLAGEADGLPPALVGLGLAWDPQWGGILLAGGALSNGSASNQTWLFDASGWTNVTALVNNASNGSLASPDEAYGSMAYDGALQEMVVVNGCDSSVHGCSGALRGETFALGPRGTTWTDLGSSFSPGAAYPGSPSTGAWGAQMAYDAPDQELVYFGGENGGSAVQDSTWAMNSTGWYNLTSTSTGCYAVLLTKKCYYPAATAFGAMTWDGELGTVLLVGGANSTYVPTSTTSEFTNGAWFPNCESVCDLATPPAESSGEMASNSSAVAPLLVVGFCLGACVGDSFVYETSPDPTLTTVSPNPSEAGVPVQVTAAGAEDAGSGPSVYGLVYDNGRLTTLTVANGVNFTTPARFGGTFTYAVPGTYTIQAGEIDYFYVSGYSPTVALTVNASLGASVISATTTAPTTTTLVTFHLSVAFGVPAYTYAWSFGDGGVSAGASPTHAFSTPGTYTVSVVVTDAVGGKLERSMNITVSKPSSSSSSLSWLTSGAGLYALVGAIAVIAVVLGVLLLRRPPPPPQAPPSQVSSGTPPTPEAPPAAEGGPPGPPSSPT